ncbi:unnamed protein product [Pieris macdunnoughi]|uniref:Uncharacterized protein n=1 Tax=Pieris macdunnoughi TaxID=345717 RepID=A0A821UQD1_9NEOP|nr:unnamed protein product [Pieris macdunnoughi]
MEDVLNKMAMVGAHDKSKKSSRFTTEWQPRDGKGKRKIGGDFNMLQPVNTPPQSVCTFGLRRSEEENLLFKFELN